MAKYNSKEFKELFDSFSKMFKEEGDIYENTKRSVQEDYKHSIIPTEISKSVILTILRDAAIEFYKKETTIITEEEYLNILNEHE